MVALGGTYEADPNNVQGDYTPLPPGDYKVHVIDSDMKDNSAKTGSYLQLELEVLEGEHQGRRVFDRLNLDNPNQQAVDIAQRTLNAICVATGKMAISDSSELHNVPMIAVLKVDPARGDYGPSNSVRTYKPAGAATPAQQQTAPSGGGSAPPWKRAAA